MASPQKENGFTPIAHEILEAVAKYPLNGTQARILCVIWRATYGYNKTEHEISESFISNATGIFKRQIQRELKELIDNNIITVINPPSFNSTRTLAFNKNYEHWKVTSKKTPDVKKDAPPDVEKDASPGVVLDVQKRKNKESKKKRLDFISIINNYTQDCNLQQVLFEFIEHREGIKKPLTELALKKTLNKLDGMENKIAVINESILRGWAGIFDIKEKTSQQIKVSSVPESPTNEEYLKLKQQLG
jgi:phage replication O-like protein O